MGIGGIDAEFAIEGKTLQLSVSKVSAEGTGEKILILTDFTDRKLAEYALRTAEKLAATGKLANAIAHEINNPLEALTNLIYLAGRSGSIDDVQDLLRHADVELARIARITKQSLSFHRDTQVPVAIDIGNLVADIVALFERTAASRRVRLVYDRKPTSSIYGFPGQLSQVFGNLVRNAAEASAPETAVAIRVKEIHRDDRKAFAFRFTIEDAGFPRMYRERCSIRFLRRRTLRAPASDYGSQNPWSQAWRNDSVSLFRARRLQRNNL